jgi:hypothetical protein
MTDMKTKAKAVKKSIDDVYWDWGNMYPADGTTIAVAALRETINQLQQCSATHPAFISCPDILNLIEEFEKL